MTTTSRLPLVRAGTVRRLVRLAGRHGHRGCGCGCGKFGFTVTRRRKTKRDQDVATKGRFPPFHDVAACCTPNPGQVGGLTPVPEDMV